MYVTSRFKGAAESRDQITALCLVVRNAGFEDFSFIRDVEDFDPNHFGTQTEVWEESLKHLRACDALLIDVSDAPSGGRNVEVGMAYALGIPIYVIVRRGVAHKGFYDGVSQAVIVYDDLVDVTEQLKLVR